jgi:hypothetical protein
MTGSDPYCPPHMGDVVGVVVVLVVRVDGPEFVDTSRSRPCYAESAFGHRGSGLRDNPVHG